MSLSVRAQNQSPLHPILEQEIFASDYLPWVLFEADFVRLMQMQKQAGSSGRARPKLLQNKLFDVARGSLK